MAFDQGLADRVRELVAEEQDLREQRMFGGLAFLVGGNIAVAASSQGGLMVRVDPETAEGLIADTSAEPMEMRDRPMRGWLHVGLDDLRTQRQLAAWVRRGVDHARSLPPK